MHFMRRFSIVDTLIKMLTGSDDTVPINQSTPYTPNQLAGLLKVFGFIGFVDIDTKAGLRGRLNDALSLVGDTPVAKFIRTLIDTEKTETYPAHKALVMALGLPAGNPIAKDFVGTPDQQLCVLDFMMYTDFGPDTRELVKDLTEVARGQQDATIRKRIGYVIGHQAIDVDQEWVNTVTERAKNPGTGYHTVYEGMAEAIQERIRNARQQTSNRTVNETDMPTLPKLESDQGMPRPAATT